MLYALCLFFFFFFAKLVTAKHFKCDLAVEQWCSSTTRNVINLKHLQNGEPQMSVESAEIEYGRYWFPSEFDQPRLVIVVKKRLFFTCETIERWIWKKKKNPDRVKLCSPNNECLLASVPSKFYRIFSLTFYIFKNYLGCHKWSL